MLRFHESVDFEVQQAAFQLYTMKTIFPAEVIGQGPKTGFETLLIQKCFLNVRQVNMNPSGKI